MLAIQNLLPKKEVHTIADVISYYGFFIILPGAKSLQKLCMSKIVHALQRFYANAPQLLAGCVPPPLLRSLQAVHNDRLSSSPRSSGISPVSSGVKSLEAACLSVVASALEECNQYLFKWLPRYVTTYSRQLIQDTYQAHTHAHSRT